MSRCLLCALMVLALPAVAADGALATELLPGSVPEVELAAPAVEPKLDLSLDAGHLPSAREIRPLPAADARDAAGRRAVHAAADAPLSFGLDVRTRQRVGDEIRAEVAAPPSLGDEIESAIDRSTFGVTGTYRF